MNKPKSENSNSSKSVEDETKPQTCVCLLCNSAVFIDFSSVHSDYIIWLFNVDRALRKQRASPIAPLYKSTMKSKFTHMNIGLTETTVGWAVFAIDGVTVETGLSLYC